MITILHATYPDAHVELTYKSPFQLLIATILSAQTTDVTVNRVTRVLFRRYGTPSALARAAIDEVEKVIFATGFYHQKAKAIIATAQNIRDIFGGRVPTTIRDLVTLPGVARKTANVVLGNAFGMNEGIAVDTHVSRLAQRLGMTRENAPEQIEQDLMRIIPQEHWTLISHLLIWHGRRQCMAKKPLCETCPLKKICPSAPLYLSKKPVRKLPK